MIADFGIARAGDDPGATATGPVGVRGTPSFMAPEQIAVDRAAIGPRSDVFALGATLYSLLTGRPPFQAASVIETLDLVRTREPAPPRTLVPGLPRDLETIALTSLRKDPRRRYASACALADDLQRWLDGFPIRARPVSKLEHASRWCRRRPAFASLLVVLAVTSASSLVGLLTLWRHSEAERARAGNALARAIESDKATSGTVHDLVGLLATTVDAPQMLASERFEKTSHAVLDLTAKLRRYRGFAASNLVAICELERQLAEDFRRRGHHAESRTLLMDSLDLLEGRRYGADDPDVDEAYARALMELGRVARSQGRFDEALVCFQRAEEALEGLVHDPRHLEVILSIDESRQAIASMFGRSGLEQPRRRLLESHIRITMRGARRCPFLASRRGPPGGRHCRPSGRGATKGGPPGRRPPDRRMSLRLREETGTKRSRRGGVSPGTVRSLRPGIKKRLESRGLRYDRRLAAEGTGRSLYRVTSRPPKRGRATLCRGSPGHAVRTRLRATFIAVSRRLSRTAGKETGTRLIFRPHSPLCPGNRTCVSSTLARYAEVTCSPCRCAAFRVSFGPKTMRNDPRAKEMNHWKRVAQRAFRQSPPIVRYAENRRPRVTYPRLL